MVAIDDKTESEKAPQVDDGSYVKPRIFTVKIPQVILGRFVKIIVQIMV